MKWPESLMLIRHGVSAYNVLKKIKEADPTYQKFLMAYALDPNHEGTQNLAKQIYHKYRLGVSDASTPLVAEMEHQIVTVGKNLRAEHRLPHIVFVSPYDRTMRTLELLQEGWPELVGVRVLEEERIREQEHGLATLYNDWRVFLSLHLEQRMLNEMEGKYRYCFPQGENIPRVRERNLLWFSTITRDYSGHRVLAVTHHLNILAIRANLDRLNPMEFLKLDEKEKPINGGVTLYTGYPDQGRDGKLVLNFYNRKYY